MILLMLSMLWIEKKVENYKQALLEAAKELFWENEGAIAIKLCERVIR